MSAAGSADLRNPSGHRIMLVGTIFYYSLTGGLATLLQGAFNGAVVDEYWPLLLFVLAAVLHDMVRVLPLFIWRRGAWGLFHPLILMITIWPIVGELPGFRLYFAPLVSLFMGLPVVAPSFLGSEVHGDSTRFLVMAALELLGALGLICLMFVYDLCERRLRQRRTPIVARPPPPFISGGMTTIFIGMIAFAALITFAFVQYRGGLDAHIASLGQGRFVALEGQGPVVVLSKIGLVALIAWVMYDPKVVRTPWFVAGVVVVALTVFVMSGSRGSLMMAFVGTALAWSLRTGRFPVRMAVILGPMLMALYGLLFIVRSFGWSDDRSGLTVYDRIAVTEVGDALTAGANEVDLRANIHGAAPVMLEGYRRTDGPLWGSSYLAITTWFIPRAIWPDKPRGAGSLYAQLFLGAQKEGAAVPIGAVAESYWNFWVPGIFLVYGLFGLIIFWANQIYLRFGADPFVGAGYVVFVTQFGMTADRIVPFIHSVLLLTMLRWTAKVLVMARVHRTVARRQDNRAAPSFGR